MRGRIDPDLECTAVRRIGEEAFSAESLARLVAALESPLESVQVVAAQALARWARAEGFAPLRDWLLRCEQRSLSIGATHQAVKCLSACACAADLPWLWAHAVERGACSAVGDWLGAIAVVTNRFPGDESRALLLAACRSAVETEARFALLVLNRVPLTDRQGIARSLRGQVTPGNQPYVDLVLSLG